MYKAALIVFLVFLNLTNTYLANGNDSTKVGRRTEIMLDFVPGINTGLSKSFESGLLYRRKINQKVAVRIGVLGGMNSYFSKDSSGHKQDNVRSFIETFVGLQRNYSLTNNTQFYWGGDIFYRYRDNSTNFQNDFGIGPIVGTTIRLRRWLLLGIEVSGKVYLSKKRFPTSTQYPGAAVNSFDFSPYDSFRAYIGLNF